MLYDPLSVQIKRRSAERTYHDGFYESLARERMRRGIEDFGLEAPAVYSEILEPEAVDQHFEAILSKKPL